MRGIFCIDPGNHTGVAWAVIDERHPISAAVAVAERLHGDSTTVEGTPLEQAKILFNLWSVFKHRCVNECRLDLDGIDLVIEDFILRPGPHAGGKDGTSPERVAYAFEGYRMGRYDTFRTNKHVTIAIWQTPSSAALYKTRDRLTQAGAWVRGREHERSAFSHMMLRVNNLMTNRRYTRSP